MSESMATDNNVPAVPYNSIRTGESHYLTRLKFGLDFKTKKEMRLSNYKVLIYKENYGVPKHQYKTTWTHLMVLGVTGTETFNTWDNQFPFSNLSSPVAHRAFCLSSDRRFLSFGSQNHHDLHFDVSHCLLPFVFSEPICAHTCASNMGG